MSSDYQLFQRVQLLINLKKYDQALKSVQELLAAYPVSSNGHFLHALVLYHLGKLDSSEEAAKISLSLLSAGAPLNLLGSIALRQRKIDKAEKLFLDALESNPNQAVFYANLSKVYIIRRDYKKAEEYSKQGLGLDPNNEDCLNNLFSVYHLSKDHKSADEVLKKNLANNPSNINTLSLRGFQLIKDQKHKEAEVAFRYILALNPDSAQAKWGLKSALSLGNRVSRAFSHPYILKPLIFIWVFTFWVLIGGFLLNSKDIGLQWYFWMALSGAQVFGFSWFGIALGKWYAFGQNRLERELFHRSEMTNASISLTFYLSSLFLLFHLIGILTIPGLEEEIAFLSAFYAALFTITFGIRTTWASHKPVIRRMIATLMFSYAVISLFIWPWTFLILVIVLFVLDWLLFKGKILKTKQFQ